MHTTHPPEPTTAVTTTSHTEAPATDLRKLFHYTLPGFIRELKGLAATEVLRVMPVRKQASPQYPLPLDDVTWGDMDALVTQFEPEQALQLGPQFYLVGVDALGDELG